MSHLIDRVLSHDSLASAYLLLAQAPAPAGAAPGAQPSSGLSMLIMPLMLVGVYFLFVAPQMKRQKEHQKLVASIETGDEVVTTGGIFGVVTQVKPDRFVVEIAKGTRIELEKTHVQARATVPDEKSGSDKGAQS
ncbi:MAG: preprotein translocase subunit YajC [Opitutales bacterium]|jgi:preprotein translocase subunit YajC